MSRVKIWVESERNPRWFSLRAISMSSSAPKRRRICSSALGGTIGPQLPQHSVQDRTAFLGARGEGNVRYELLELPRLHFPAGVELDGGEGRELVPGQPQELEARLATFKRDALFPRGGHPNSGAGQLPDDFNQLLGREGDRTLLVHRGRHRGRHGDIQVGAGKTETVLSRLDQDVGKHRKRGLRRHCCRDGDESLLQVVSCDRELHAASWECGGE
jgi:hypothetical protein